MQKEKLFFKYTQGQERSEVIETSDFNKSIFSEQYSQALRLIESFLNNYHSESCQILAFCGDRGEGKSSCLKTVHSILKKANQKDGQITNTGTNSDGNDNDSKSTTNTLYHNIDLYLKSLDIKSIQNTQFEVLEIIDPAFFDKGHNVQELVVGQMYTEFRKHYSGTNAAERIKLNEVLKKFERVKHCVTTLKKAEKGNIDEYDELETLAYSMTLKKDINDLILAYLDIQGKTNGKLVVTVDDIDLNMEEAYKMCEQVRKYLSNEHTIILLAVKTDQLHQAVARALRKSSEPSDDLQKSSDTMAEKYLAKFIPAHARINMPSIYDIRDRYLKIGETVYDGHTIMDTILELIFQRTRYLFYNSMGGVSPLIPTNLRGFLQLLALIGEMHNLDAYEDDKGNPKFKQRLEENKHRFKDYFFNEWLRFLTKEQQVKILELVNLADYTLFNKKVCLILNDLKSTIEKRAYQDEESDDVDEEISSMSISKEDNVMENVNRIVSVANFAYNVTIGDVFYIIHLLEKVDLTIQQQYLLFFIKSLYSMRLYEAYDAITERNSDIYSNEEALEAGIYRYDSRFTDTNELQRLTGGSYFSYPSGTVIGVSSDHKQSIDCCILDTSKGINEFVEKANEIVADEIIEFFKATDTPDCTLYDKLDLFIDHEILRDPFTDGFQLYNILNNIFAFNAMEFIVLTTCQNVTQKELERYRPDKLHGNFRLNVTPCFLTRYKKSSKRYILFDILAPFANIVNPKFSYSRWEDYIPGFFDTAIDLPWSLLRKMIGEVVKSRLGEDEYKNYKEKEKLNESEKKEYLQLLQSDGIIRNGEVLAAMYENILERKGQLKKKSSIDNIHYFLFDMAPSYMATYKSHTKANSGYKITFSFLRAMGDSMEKIMRYSTFDNDFYNIFSKVVPSKENKVNTDEIHLNSKESRLFNRLNEVMNNRSLTGAEIRDELSRLYPSFSSLSGTEKASYVRTKKGSTMDKFELFRYVTASTARIQKWCDLLNI